MNFRLMLTTALIGVAAVLGVRAQGAEAATMVYVSNADSREIYVMTLNNQDGSLDVVEKIAVTGTVMPLAISPDRRFLYASLRSAPYSVSTFGIDRVKGTLQALSTVPLADNMAYLSTDKTGHFLFGASYTGDKISINPIGEQGSALTPPVQVIATRKNAHAIMTDPSNTYLFASNLGGDIILQYHFDAATGRVSPNSPPYVETKQGAGPRHFIFSPNHRFVYGTDELDGTVNTYRFDAAAGTLTLIGSNTVVPPGTKEAPAAADIHITPDGRFLYASERTSNTLTGFRVDGETGTLTAVGTFPTETQPRGFNIDQKGRYLLAVGQKSNSLTSYAIDPSSGSLTPLHKYPMGQNPNWVEIVDIP